MSRTSHDVSHSELVVELQTALTTAEEEISKHAHKTNRATLVHAKLNVLRHRISGISRNEIVKLEEPALAMLLTKFWEAFHDLRSALRQDKLTRENEIQVHKSCELIGCAIDEATSAPAVSFKDLIMPDNSMTDPSDYAMPRIKGADIACRRLKRVHTLLSERMSHCNRGNHFAKLRLCQLGGGQLHFLFSKCQGNQGWYSVPCVVRHKPLLRDLPPLRGCIDFHKAEARNNCLILHLEDERGLRADRVPVTPELVRDSKGAYGTFEAATKSFLTLRDVLCNPSKPSVESISPLPFMRFFNHFTSSLISAGSSTEEKEMIKDNKNYRSDLTVHMAMVQYLISESVFHLHSSPWLLDIWQPKDIEFFNVSTVPNFQEPYLSCDLSTSDINTEPIFDHLTEPELADLAENRMAKFGLLLLQLQLQQVLPLTEKDWGQDFWPWEALSENFEKYRSSKQYGGLVEPIKEILGACLDFRELLWKTPDGGKKGDALNFRTTFYKHILMPLHEILVLRSPEIAIKIQDALASYEPLDEEAAKYVNDATNGENIGETMLKRSVPTPSTSWFQLYDEMATFLDEDKFDKSPYPADPIRVAIIDSGLLESRRSEPNIHYKSFIENWNMKHKDNPQHGTDSVDLVRKAYPRAKLYVARVFQDNEADPNTAIYMAQAIAWAIREEVDIISISAGFRHDNHEELKREIERATAGGHKKEILVFAAASNWQNIHDVAFPASRTDRVICMFCCNGGMTPSMHWNPAPRADSATRFAMMGEDVELESGGLPRGGTSVSTALAAGFAARLLDFSCQPGIQMSERIRKKMRTKRGMDAIFRDFSKDHQGYQCIVPWKILPAHDIKKASTKEEVRNAMCRTIERIVG